jgi:outer membrane protein TolC
MLRLTLPDALERARTNGGLVLLANYAAQLAHEDTVQAKAALLPALTWFNQFIYTQPNGTPPGIFVSNDGPHVYNNQAQLHGDIFAPGKIADYHRAEAAEVVARAKADVAARGIYATVVQNYYAMVAASRKLVSAQEGQREAEQFLDITQKLEQGGEIAHSDVVTAQILAEQRVRDTQDAVLAVEKAKFGLAILVFPEFRRDFTVEDDLETLTVLPDFPKVQSLASANNPDLRAAQAAVEQQRHETSSARAAYYPSLSFDYFYGINANQYAVNNRQGLNNLGSVAQAQLSVPVWNWGATRSKVRQSEIRLLQARTELSLTQRQLLANLNGYYQEADVASGQIASLRRSLNLSQESLRLILLRYQAGEVMVLEVKDAQTTLIQARNAYDDGLVRYRAAVSELQTITGAF